MAAALIALLVGCGRKPDAPFGLKWRVDSVSFVKDGDCEKKAGMTTLGNGKLFNDLSYYRTLRFDKNGLFEV
nr:hypothetical protein [Providencia stuartii]